MYLAGDNDTGEVSVTDNKDIGKSWITSNNEASPILLTRGIGALGVSQVLAGSPASLFTHESQKDSNISENLKNIEK